MVGSVTLLAVTPLKSTGVDVLFSSAGSRRDLSFATRNTCNSVVKAAIAEAVPAIETKRWTSLYEVLRVKRNASPIEIKTAYRSLAKVYHPDSSESDGRDFIKIHNAYATLSDPAARALYDLTLSVGSGRRRSQFEYNNRSGFYPTRRWETDQCW